MFVSHPLVEEFLDEGLPEVLFDSFGLEQQAVVQLAQRLHEAERRCRRPEVSAAEVLRQTCRTQTHLSDPTPRGVLTWTGRTNQHLHEEPSPQETNGYHGDRRCDQHGLTL